MRRIIKNTQIRSSGVYQILSLANGKCYIGSAINISKRIFGGHHLADLRKGKHKNTHLQRHYNKYGELDLQFVILELVRPLPDETIVEFGSRLLAREQYYMDLYNATNRERGFNSCPVAGSWLGNHHTPESKQKIRTGLIARRKEISESQKAFLQTDAGIKHRKETSKRMSSKDNPVNDPEVVKKISQASTLLWQDAEYRVKVIASLNTPEVRAKRKETIDSPEYKQRSLAKFNAALERLRNKPPKT